MKLRRLSEVLAERRRSPRTSVKYIQLAYWNGSQGVVKPIREANAYGAFVETEDRWYPGTLMQTQLVVTLPAIPDAAKVEDRSSGGNAEAPETAAAAGGEEERVIAEETAVAGAAAGPAGGSEPPAAPGAAPSEVHTIPLMSRIVRCVPQGICVEFIVRNSKEQRALRNLLVAVEERSRAIETAEASERARREQDSHPEKQQTKQPRTAAAGGDPMPPLQCSPGTAVN